MNSLILIVEDNEVILFNIKLFLEMQNFQTLTALNGADALETLKKSTNLPDIIVSDIMMPIMNGYEFYQKVSEIPAWSSIPFVFVNAKSSPEDIRLAKKLGVDDYITKPFEEEDLLATIQGKILKSQRNRIIKLHFEEKLKSLVNSNEASSKILGEKPILFLLDWDEQMGAVLKNTYPENADQEMVEKIGQQLFSTAMAFYGTGEYSKGDGTLIRMHNFGLDAYIFYDAIADNHVRGNQRLYMMVLTFPKINYLEALRIRDLLREMAEIFKTKKLLNFKHYWEKIMEILT
jgi:CheY-like chemotaxis protein